MDFRRVQLRLRATEEELEVLGIVLRSVPALLMSEGEAESARLRPAAARVQAALKARLVEPREALVAKIVGAPVDYEEEDEDER